MITPGLLESQYDGSEKKKNNKKNLKNHQDSQMGKLRLKCWSHSHNKSVIESVFISLWGINSHLSWDTLANIFKQMPIQ